jgi:hypothetical protein
MIVILGRGVRPSRSEILFYTAIGHLRKAP